MRRRCLTLALLATAISWAGTPAMAEESECYNDWSVAAAIVEKEKLLTVDKLTSGAKTTLTGDIVKTTLCKVDGKFVFRLVLRDKGTLKTVTVDARDPLEK